MVYVSPEGSSIHELRNLDIHMELVRQITALEAEGYACYLVGDFNGRTGTASDFVELDNNSIYLPLDEEYAVDNDSIPIRCNEDIVLNNFGRQLLDICKMTGVRIVNGRYHADANIGKFTCHTANNGHSTVDYLLAKTSDIGILSEFSVGDMSVVSRDHCPLTFTLRISCNMDFRHNNRDTDCSIGYKYVWSVKQADIYRNNLSSTDSLDTLRRLCDNLTNNRIQLNSAVDSFNSILEQAAVPFRRTQGQNIYPGVRPNQPRWWTDECQTWKRHFQDAWIIYKRNRNVATYDMYQSARRRYRNCCRFHRKRHSDAMVTNMCLHMENQPKLFWRALKRRKPSPLPDMPANDILSHFARLTTG